jgi:hypothetical protein
MRVGFKTGPRTWEEGKIIVLEDKMDLCELWFDVTKAGLYTKLFAWLKDHGVAIGLHHWGLIQGKVKTNLATHHSFVRDETIAQIKRTIDIAAEHGCVYVNAHPGSQSLEEINFVEQTQAPLPDPKTPEVQAVELLLQAAHTLSSYAQERNVVFTIETLPPLEANWRDTGVRDRAYTPGNIPLSGMITLARSGVFIANDLTHTAGWVAVENKGEPSAMWAGIQKFSQEIASQTKLLHINTVVPPFDGTDSHHGLLPEDVEVGAWPSHEQFREFFTLFRDRDDVFVIPEPREHMRENTRMLRELVESVGG